jgi:hypothetical protein
MALILGLSNTLGCRQNTAPEFPTKKIYEVIQGRDDCTVYTIVQDDPLQVDEGVSLPNGECPESVFGFAAQDVGPVFSWIRKVQDIIKKSKK